MKRVAFVWLVIQFTLSDLQLITASVENKLQDPICGVNNECNDQEFLSFTEVSTDDEKESNDVNLEIDCEDEEIQTSSDKLSAEYDAVSEIQNTKKIFEEAIRKTNEVRDSDDEIFEDTERNLIPKNDESMGEGKVSESDFEASESYDKKSTFSNKLLDPAAGNVRNVKETLNYGKNELNVDPKGVSHNYDEMTRMNRHLTGSVDPANINPQNYHVPLTPNNGMLRYRVPSAGSLGHPPVPVYDNRPLSNPEMGRNYNNYDVFNQGIGNIHPNTGSFGPGAVGVGPNNGMFNPNGVGYHPNAARLNYIGGGYHPNADIFNSNRGRYHQSGAIFNPYSGQFHSSSGGPFNSANQAYHFNNAVGPGQIGGGFHPMGDQTKSDVVKFKHNSGRIHHYKEDLRPNIGMYDPYASFKPNYGSFTPVGLAMGPNGGRFNQIPPPPIPGVDQQGAHNIRSSTYTNEDDPGNNVPVISGTNSPNVANNLSKNETGFKQEHNVNEIDPNVEVTGSTTKQVNPNIDASDFHGGYADPRNNELATNTAKLNSNNEGAKPSGNGSHDKMKELKTDKDHPHGAKNIPPAGGGLNSAGNVAIPNIGNTVVGDENIGTAGNEKNTNIGTMDSSGVQHDSDNNNRDDEGAKFDDRSEMLSPNSDIMNPYGEGLIPDGGQLGPNEGFTLNRQKSIYNEGNFNPSRGLHVDGGQFNTFGGHHNNGRLIPNRGEQFLHAGQYNPKVSSVPNGGKYNVNMGSIPDGGKLNPYEGLIPNVGQSSPYEGFIPNSERQFNRYIEQFSPNSAHYVPYMGKPIPNGGVPIPNIDVMNPYHNRINQMTLNPHYGQAAFGQQKEGYYTNGFPYSLNELYGGIPYAQVTSDYSNQPSSINIPGMPISSVGWINQISKGYRSNGGRFNPTEAFNPNAYMTLENCGTNYDYGWLNFHGAGFNSNGGVFNPNNARFIQPSNPLKPGGYVGDNVNLAHNKLNRAKRSSKNKSNNNFDSKHDTKVSQHKRVPPNIKADTPYSDVRSQLSKKFIQSVAGGARAEIDAHYIGNEAGTHHLGTSDAIGVTHSTTYPNRPNYGPFNPNYGARDFVSEGYNSYYESPNWNYGNTKYFGGSNNPQYVFSRLNFSPGPSLGTGYHSIYEPPNTNYGTANFVGRMNIPKPLHPNNKVGDFIGWNYEQNSKLLHPNFGLLDPDDRHRPNFGFFNANYERPNSVDGKHKPINEMLNPISGPINYIGGRYLSYPELFYSNYKTPYSLGERLEPIYKKLPPNYGSMNPNDEHPQNHESQDSNQEIMNSFIQGISPVGNIFNPHYGKPVSIGNILGLNNAILNPKDVINSDAAGRFQTPGELLNSNFGRLKHNNENLVPLPKFMNPENEGQNEIDLHNYKLFNPKYKNPYDNLGNYGDHYGLHNPYYGRENINKDTHGPAHDFPGQYHGKHYHIGSKYELPHPHAQQSDYINGESETNHGKAVRLNSRAHNPYSGGIRTFDKRNDMISENNAEERAFKANSETSGEFENIANPNVESFIPNGMAFRGAFDEDRGGFTPVNSMDHNPQSIEPYVDETRWRSKEENSRLNIGIRNPLWKALYTNKKVPHPIWKDEHLTGEMMSLSNGEYIQNGDLSGTMKGKNIEEIIKHYHKFPFGVHYSKHESNKNRIKPNSDIERINNPDLSDLIKYLNLNEDVNGFEKKIIYPKDSDFTEDGKHINNGKISELLNVGTLQNSGSLLNVNSEKFTPNGQFFHKINDRFIPFSQLYHTDVDRYNPSGVFLQSDSRRYYPGNTMINEKREVYVPHSALSLTDSKKFHPIFGAVAPTRESQSTNSEGFDASGGKADRERNNPPVFFHHNNGGSFVTDKGNFDSSTRLFQTNKQKNHEGERFDYLNGKSLTKDEKISLLHRLLKSLGGGINANSGGKTPSDISVPLNVAGLRDSSGWMKF